MSPSTRAWLGSLPVGVRPTALPKQYPRIVNVLARAWTRPIACRLYLDDLMIDRRGNRRGFPSDVYSELSNLWGYYQRLHA